jgi:hypothetical protein
MNGYIAHIPSLNSGADGIGRLSSRIAEFQRLTAEVSSTLSGGHAWGQVGKIHLHSECMSLIRGFQAHLQDMKDAVSGAQARLRKAASNYSGAEGAVLSSLGNSLEQEGGVRPLNWASRFYQDHRLANGVLTALPYPFGEASEAFLGGGRLISDLSSDDKYNVLTDSVNLIDDIPSVALTYIGFRERMAGDPMGYLVEAGVGFLLNALYTTKKLADRLTGDPLTSGQAAYNFDSLAEACGKLAADLKKMISGSLGHSAWQGAAADAARQRLTELSNAIAETARSAEGVAAMLQLASAIIADAEFVARQALTALVTWAVMIWLTAQLLAPATGGASMAAAMEKTASEVARSANMIKRLIDEVSSLFRRIAALFKRMVATLAKAKREGFAKLQKSAWGQKFLKYDYGAPVYRAAILKDAMHKGRHVKIGNVDLGFSLAVQTRRLPLTQALKSFGFNRYWNDKQGALFNPAKVVISPIRIPREGKSTLYNWPLVGARTLQTAFPLGRAYIYWKRSEDGPDELRF